MTLIDVWNASIAEISIRKASAEVLDLLMLRNARFQNVKRDGVFIMYHGEKIWYYDKKSNGSILEKRSMSEFTIQKTDIFSAGNAQTG